MRARRRHRLLLGAALAVALAALAPVRAPAETDLELRAQVEAILRAIESAPARPALDGIAGLESAAVLREIAADLQAPAEARVQAYAALHAYPGDAQETFLREAILVLGKSTAGLNTLYLRAAARSFGAIGGVAAVAVLGDLLDHPVKDVRADAATALALTGAPEALPILRAHLLREEDPLVRLALTDAVRALTSE